MPIAYSLRVAGAILILAAASASGGSPPSFGTPVSYPAQNGPVAAISADFNGDGHPDLAVANLASSSISIFPGNGDGTFGAPTVLTIPGPCTPSFLAAGAFVHSGSKTDLLAVCGFQQSIVVIPSSSKGFGTPVATQLPQAVLSGFGGEIGTTPVVADFNGDGLLDLSLTLGGAFNFSNLAAFVLLNNGDGTFRSPVQLPLTGLFPSGAAAGDFNRDGKMDLALVGTDNNSRVSILYILTGDGSGAFKITAQYPSSVSLVLGALIAADVNGDGIVDLVGGGIASISSIGSSTPFSSIAVFKGKGDGTFQAGQTLNYPGFITYLAPADLHSSGIPDLVAATFNPTTLVASAVQFPGNGDGSFQTWAVIPIAGSSPFPFQFAVEDFNGDGAADLAFPTYTSNAVASIFSGSGVLNHWSDLAALLGRLPGGDVSVMLNTTPAPPLISSVTNNASGAPRLSGFSWITIKGSHLSTSAPRVWALTDFVNGALPLSLGGVSVTIDGTKASVEYTSSSQINALAPPDNTTGNIQVEVTTSAGTSAPFNVPLAQYSPAFFTYSPPNNRYVAGTLLTGEYLAPPGAFGPGAVSSAAKPGDTVVLYGTGFGPTTPPTAFGSGSIIPGPLAGSTTFTIGGQPAAVLFEGMTSVGEDQFNVVIPAGVAAGDQPVVATIQGVSTQTGIFIPVQP